MESGVRFLVLAGESLRDRLHLDRRLVQRHARTQPPHRGEPLPLVARRLERVERERHPDLLVLRKGEALGHDPDHRVRLSIHANGAVEDVGGAAVPVLPHGVAENGHARTARPFLAVAKVASDHRAHAEHGEQVRGHERAVESLGALDAAHVDRAVVVAGEPLERALLRSELHQVGVGHPRVVDVARGMVALDDHDALGARKGQPAQHGAVDDAEHRGREPDADAEREHGDDDEAGTLAKGARGEAEIAEQSIHDARGLGTTA